MICKVKYVDLKNGGKIIAEVSPRAGKWVAAWGRGREGVVIAFAQAKSLPFVFCRRVCA